MTTTRDGIPPEPPPPPDSTARTTRCGCECICGDDDDVDGPGTCKGLPLPKREPLVEIVLVDRRTGNVV